MVEQADMILMYDAFDSAGETIATAQFAAIVDDYSTLLSCIWLSPTAGLALEKCSEIVSFELNPSSVAF